MSENSEKHDGINSKIIASFISEYPGVAGLINESSHIQKECLAMSIIFIDGSKEIIQLCSGSELKIRFVFRLAGFIDGVLKEAAKIGENKPC